MSKIIYKPSQSKTPIPVKEPPTGLILVQPVTKIHPHTEIIYQSSEISPDKITIVESAEDSITLKLPNPETNFEVQKKIFISNNKKVFVETSTGVLYLTGNNNFMILLFTSGKWVVIDNGELINTNFVEIIDTSILDLLFPEYKLNNDSDIINNNDINKNQQYKLFENINFYKTIISGTKNFLTVALPNNNLIFVFEKIKLNYILLEILEVENYRYHIISNNRIFVYSNSGKLILFNISHQNNKDSSPDSNSDSNSDLRENSNKVIKDCEIIIPLTTNNTEILNESNEINFELIPNFESEDNLFSVNQSSNKLLTKNNNKLLYYTFDNVLWRLKSEIIIQEESNNIFKIHSVETEYTENAIIAFLDSKIQNEVKQNIIRCFTYSNINSNDINNLDNKSDNEFILEVPPNNKILDICISDKNIITLNQKDEEYSIFVYKISKNKFEWINTIILDSDSSNNDKENSNNNDNNESEQKYQDEKEDSNNSNNPNINNINIDNLSEENKISLENLKSYKDLDKKLSDFNRKSLWFYKSNKYIFSKINSNVKIFKLQTDGNYIHIKTIEIDNCKVSDCCNYIYTIDSSSDSGKILNCIEL